MLTRFNLICKYYENFFIFVLYIRCMAKKIEDSTPSKHVSIRLKHAFIDEINKSATEIGVNFTTFIKLAVKEKIKKVKKSK